MQDAAKTHRVDQCRAELARGDYAKAEAMARTGLVDADMVAACHGVIGAAQLAQGRTDDAIASFNHAVALGDRSADLLYARGVAYQAVGRQDEARQSWRQAVAAQPDHADALCNLILATMQAGDWPQAEGLAAQALDLAVPDPRLPLWYGHALAKQHRDDEAVLAYRRAVTAAPEDPAAWFFLALGLRDVGAFSAARAALDWVLNRFPDHVEAQYEAAQLDLMMGHWQRGFTLWESRLKRSVSLLPTVLPGQRWDGQVVRDATLLLQAEQGYGDVLQFMRYVPMAAERVGAVVVRVQAPLVRLLSRADLPCRLVAMDALVEADFHAPLLSLPHLLHDYDPCAEHAGFLAKCGSRGCGPKTVGLVWAGNPAHHNDARRSCPFAALSSLQQVPGVRFVHFQFGVKPEQLQDWPDLQDGTIGIRDFADTAERLIQCDVLITVDTAAAHLAGALGIPAWVMVPFAPDWRWGAQGDQTPWYPSARVWRQPQPGDWHGLVANLLQSLMVFSVSDHCP